MRQEKHEILSDKQARSASRGRALIVGTGIGLSLAVVSALATVPGQRSGELQVRHVVESVSASPTLISDADHAPFVHIERIVRGDTLRSILARVDAEDQGAVGFIASTQLGARAVRNLRAGRSISASVAPDGRLQTLEIPVSGSEVYVLHRDQDDFRESQRQIAASSVIKMRSGTITSSLFGAAERAGLPDEATMKLAELFGTEINFHTDLRKGDHFSVIYEARTRDGAEVGVGRILAAEFSNRGRTHTVIHYENSKGEAGYYTPEGRNLKQAFLRSPLAFTRVTSGFKMRYHPIKKKWRRHQGVDFGARRGTAIKATSDGKIEFVGRKGGYGKTVVIRHRNRITTLYAHMSRFHKQARRGARVSQGDVIGYVGSTGWATGPHLHYEFRKNGKPVNPMAITLPSAEPLARRELSSFKKVASLRLEQLAMLNYTSPLALAH